jgi:hypothetical protein
MAEVVFGLPTLNAEIVPKGDAKEKETKEQPSVINWTTMALTLFFFPAFVAFQNAIQETIDYNLPQPNSGIVWFNSLGQNSTLVQCYAPVTTGARVAWAWGSFVILLGFGFLAAFVILWIHAHYYQWHKFARREDAHMTRAERIHRLRQRLETFKKGSEQAKLLES